MTLVVTVVQYYREARNTKSDRFLHFLQNYFDLVIILQDDPKADKHKHCFSFFPFFALLLEYSHTLLSYPSIRSSSIVMYGLVFEIIEEFVIEKQGIDVWHAIKAKAKCGMEDFAFVRRSHYEDSECVAIVAAAAEVLGTTVPVVLEMFGHCVIR